MTKALHFVNDWIENDSTIVTVHGSLSYLLASPASQLASLSDPKHGDVRHLIYQGLLYMFPLHVFTTFANFCVASSKPWEDGNWARYGRRLMAIRNTRPDKGSLFSFIHCDKVFSELAIITRFLISTLLTWSIHPTA